LEDEVEACCLHGRQSCIVSRSVDDARKTNTSDYEQVVEFSELVPPPTLKNETSSDSTDFSNFSELDRNQKLNNVCCMHDDRKKPELVALASLEPVNDASLVFLQSGWKGKGQRDDDTVTIYENAKPVTLKKVKTTKGSKATRKSSDCNLDGKACCKHGDNCKAKCKEARKPDPFRPTSAVSGYDNIFLAEENGVLESEYPPSRNPSLRITQKSAPASPLAKELKYPNWGKDRQKPKNDTTTAKEANGAHKPNKEKVTEDAIFNRNELVKKLSDLKMAYPPEFDSVELVVIGQLIVALLFLVASVALSVTGASLSPALFYAGVLIAVQLSPTISLWLLDSAHVSFAFRTSSQVCAFSNGLMSIASWMLESGQASRVIFLLVIATLQFGSLCLLNCCEYKEKQKRKQKKRAGKAI